MAIVWSAYKKITPSSNNSFRIGIDLTSSRQTTTLEGYIQFTGGSTGNVSVHMNVSGSGTRNNTFSGISVSDTTQQYLGVLLERSYSYGTSVTYTVTGWATNNSDANKNTVSTSITVSSTTPAAPTSLSVSNIEVPTAQATWNRNSDTGGSPIIRDEIQVCTGSTFNSSTIFIDQQNVTSPFTITGLVMDSTYRVRVRSVNANGEGSWATSAVISTAAPLVPGTPTLVRNSDTSMRVNWQRNASTNNPVELQEIQRQSPGSTGWTTVLSVTTRYTSSASSYTTDTTVSAGNVYRYRVKASNDSGTSYSDVSIWGFTTPAPVGSLTAQRVSTTETVLTWVPSIALPEIVYYLDVSTNGGSSWTSLASGVAGNTYTHTGVSNSTAYVYRIRPRVVSTGAAGDGLYGVYLSSNTVPIAAAPNAPTVTSPNGAFDATTPISATWIHTPSDTSIQTKYNISYRNVGGEWVYVDPTMVGISGSSQSYIFPANTFVNGNSVEIRVMTWGVHVDGSPWSIPKTFEVSSKPTVSIVSPESDEWLTAKLYVEWLYIDSASLPQSSTQIQLLDGSSVVVEDKTITGTATSYMLNTIMPNETTWTVRLRSSNTLGLWSDWASQTIHVSYPPPPDPVIIGSWIRDTGSVSLHVDVPEPVPPLQVPAHSVTIYRRINGEGDWVLLADQVGLDDNITDYIPTINGVNEYRVVVFSEDGASNDGNIYSVDIDEPYWHYLNSGTGFTHVVKYWANPEIDVESTRDKQLYHFANASEKNYPVELSSESVTKTFHLTGALSESSIVGRSLASSTSAEFENFGQSRGVVVYRDPTGHRVFSSVGGVGWQKSLYAVGQPKTFKITLHQVEHFE